MKKCYTILWLAAMVLFTVPADGQSLKSLSKAAYTVSNRLRGLDLTGTWDYTGSSVAFESGSLLRKAGGAVAANKIESSLDSQLEKIGFTPGVTSFTFNDDGTFSNYLNGRTVSGTYEYDSAEGVLTLKYANHLPVRATLTGSGNSISLLFETGGFLSLATFIGSHSGSSILGGLSSIAGGYDGMLTGMELHRR